MSTKNILELDASDEVCASCGTAAIDDIKLKVCDGGCDLVKYCSDGCRELHRPEHIGVCKKRAAEIRDDKLFRQPDESHLGECPICCLPLPLDTRKSRSYDCCTQSVCLGCLSANIEREMDEGLESKCPYCREPLGGKTKEEKEARKME